LAVLSCICLAQGRATEAAELAERALSHSRACGMGYCIRHAMLLLVRAEALHALGDRDAACQAGQDGSPGVTCAYGPQLRLFARSAMRPMAVRKR
jgi:hypothetical protein